MAGAKWLTVPLILAVSLPLAWRRTAPLLTGSIVLGAIVVQGLVTGSTPKGIPFIVIWALVPYGMVGLHGPAAIAHRAGDRARGVRGLRGPERRRRQRPRGRRLVGRLLPGHGRRRVARGHRRSQPARDRRRSREREPRPSSRSPRSARGSRASCTTSSRTTSASMVVQAGGRRAPRPGPGDAARRCEKIERSGREALVEMRRLLGVLRDDERRRRLAPQPGARAAARARRARPGGRAAGRPRGRGRPRRAPARRRPVRLPDRAGGADEHAQARRPAHASVPVRAAARAGTSCVSRSPTTAPGRRRRTAAATGSSACASASRCSAAAARRARGRAAASRPCTHCRCAGRE